MLRTATDSGQQRRSRYPHFGLGAYHQLTSAAGRTASRTIDELGRLTAGQMAGRNVESYLCDSQGRLQSSSIGSGADTRTTTYAYDANGFLAAVTDPMNRMVTYSNNPMGPTITNHSGRRQPAQICL